MNKVDRDKGYIKSLRASKNVKQKLDSGYTVSLTKKFRHAVRERFILVAQNLPQKVYSTESEDSLLENGLQKCPIS